MAALYSIWKRLSHLRLDGINYDIGVKEREDGRYTVSWVCLKCFEQGPASPTAETLEQAASFAEIGLRAHHGLMHAARRDPETNQLAAPTCASGNGTCNGEDSHHAAYERARSAFEKLCSAHARLRTCNAQAKQSEAANKQFVAACREWTSMAFEFDEALNAYSEALRHRAQDLDAKLDNSAAV